MSGNNPALDCRTGSVSQIRRCKVHDLPGEKKHRHAKCQGHRTAFCDTQASHLHKYRVYMITIVTSHGDIGVELFEETGPISSENFTP